MRRWFSSLLIILAIAFFRLARGAAVGLVVSLLMVGGLNAGSLTLLGVGKPTGVTGYVGPGNVTSGATAFYGMRAWTTAIANAGASTNALIDVLGATTATACTVYVAGGGNGGMDLTTAGAGGLGAQCLLGATTFCTVTNTSCTVSKIYDQTANANHASQATTAQQPTLTFNCINSQPCLTFVRASSQQLGALSAASSANNASMSSVSMRTGAFTTLAAIVSRGGNSTSAIRQIYGTTAVITLSGSGATISATAADSVWHATNTNGPVASATIDVDGATTTGSAGNGTNGTRIFLGARADGLQPFEGKLTEAIVYPSATVTPTTMCQNQQAYYGSGNFGAVC